MLHRSPVTLFITDVLAGHETSAFFEDFNYQVVYAASSNPFSMSMLILTHAAVCVKPRRYNIHTCQPRPSPCQDSYRLKLYKYLLATLLLIILTAPHASLKHPCCRA
jgi:hypothetical protein